MLTTLQRLGRKFRIGSLQHGDYTEVSDRPVENYDAVTAARSGKVDPMATGDAGQIPPNYVKSYDEGRPRK